MEQGAFCPENKLFHLACILHFFPLNDIILKIKGRLGDDEMNYRIQYIFKGTRDKGHEIADYYGTYQSYELVQEQEYMDCSVFDSEGVEFPSFPKTEYLGFDKNNSKMRSRVKEDKLSTDLPVFDNTADKDMDEFPVKFKDAVWVEREMAQLEYDLENEQFPLVGTELVNFLNFDIDCFMNGGCQLLWKFDSDNQREYIAGWQKTEGHDLNKPWVRRAVNAFSVAGSWDSDDRLHDGIPFLICMFGCSFIDKEKWEYNLEEVQKIKVLQERLKVFCSKVFMPKDENDKRSNFERYCQEIKEISRKELRNFIPKGWFMPNSLEQALAIECYAMVKGDVNLYVCENCGLYTVSDDKRSRLCRRLYYDGRLYDDREDVFREYRYQCKEEKYHRDASLREKTDIVESITQHERKRLYHHMIDNMKLEDINIRDALAGDFSEIIKRHKEKYKNIISNAETEDIAVRSANEYLKLIEEEVDSIIAKRMGNLREDYRFKKKKNTEVKSLQGNIFK